MMPNGVGHGAAPSIIEGRAVEHYAGIDVSLERRVVDDPGLDRPVLLDRRQHHRAHLASGFSSEQGAIPTKCSKKRCCAAVRRSRLGCHRFHALALARPRRHGAVIPQRASPVRVPDHARKPLNIPQIVLRSLRFRDSSQPPPSLNLAA
jgi:hypothetical protein